MNENQRKAVIESNKRRATTQAYRNTSEYMIWISMRQRCNNPNCKAYPRYGGRGITVCERWDSFFNFLDDMGTRPPGMSIDRIDNDSGYRPDNCRWTDRITQNNNKTKSYSERRKAFPHIPRTLGKPDHRPPLDGSPFLTS